MNPMAAWSVGKYAKRSATIHLNSDAEAQITKIAEGAVTGCDVARTGITLEHALTQAAVGFFLRISTDTGTEFREITVGNDAANDVTVGAAFTAAIIDNGTLRNGTYELYSKFFYDNSNNSSFDVTIPNIIGYPEWNRCLMQVMSVTTSDIDPSDAAMDNDKSVKPVICGVELSGIAVHNSFSNTIGFHNINFTNGEFAESQLVGVVPLESLPGGNGTVGRSYVSSRSILDDGVLTSSPFGKRIRVRLKNMTTGDDLVMQPNPVVAANLEDGEVRDNPVHIVLRLLFLDSDEVPDR